MALLSKPKKLAQAFSILSPIQAILARILPGFLKKDLKDPKIRAEIVDLADAALLTEAPGAQLVPEKLRKKLIRKALGTAIDHILLPL